MIPSLPDEPTRQPTPKQQAYIEARWAGLIGKDAYMEAYDCDNPVTAAANAAKLESHPLVGLRVRDGLERIANRTQSVAVARQLASVEWIVRTAIEIVEQARHPREGQGKPQLPAAATLLSMLTRLHPDAFAERVQVDQSVRLQVDAMRTISSMSPADLRALIAAHSDDAEIVDSTLASSGDAELEDRSVEAPRAARDDAGSEAASDDGSGLFTLPGEA